MHEELIVIPQNQNKWYDGTIDVNPIMRKLSELQKLSGLKKNEARKAPNLCDFALKTRKTLKFVTDCPSHSGNPMKGQHNIFLGLTKNVITHEYESFRPVCKKKTKKKTINC